MLVKSVSPAPNVASSLTAPNSAISTPVESTAHLPALSQSLVSSSTPGPARMVTRQTDRSIDSILGRPSSLDSIIETLPDGPDSPGPLPPVKGKGKVNPLQLSPSVESIPAAAKQGSPSKALKGETATAGVKRLDVGLKKLDARFSALAARVEGGSATTAEQLDTLQARVRDLAEVASAFPGAASLNTTITELVAANNSVVDAISELRQQSSHALQAIRETDNRVDTIHRLVVDDTGNVDMGILVPSAKRARSAATTATHISTLTPVGLPAGDPTAPRVWASAMDEGTAGQGATAFMPSSVGAGGSSVLIPQAPHPVTSRQLPLMHAPNLNSFTPNANIPVAPAPAARGHEVEVGPLIWGKDITGQLSALMGMLPNGHTLAPNNMRACRGRAHFIVVRFPSDLSASNFVEAWARNPPPAFANLQVSHLGN